MTLRLNFSKLGLICTPN